MAIDIRALMFAAAVPALLLAVFGIFRWRYVRLIERTIRAGGVPARAEPIAPASNADTQPHVAFEFDGSSEPASMCATTARMAVGRVRGALQLAFLVSALVYTVAQTVVVYVGQSAAVAPRAAVALAFFSTLPSLYVAVAFTRPRIRMWFIAAAAWFLAGFSLLTVGLRVPWQVAVGIMGDGMSFVAPALTCVIPLTWRTTRGLLVGFVPLVGLWLAISTAASLGLAALGFDLAGPVTLPVGLMGLTATAVGVAIAVRAIRHGVKGNAVIVLASLLCIGALASWWTNFTLATALVAGIGFNGLMTIVLWSAFAGFLRLKTDGFLPDEVLHVALCWLACTVFLGIFSRAETVSQIPMLLLPGTAAVATLYLLLTKTRARRPAIEHKRLLLLRVFTESSARRRLLAMLENSWRHVGSIDIVVGVDLAAQTLGAVALQDFLLGRVDRLIVTSTRNVDVRRRSTLPLAVDGRFPVNEFLCEAGVWQAVVTGLVDAADVVLMDLRGFSAENRGAAFELSLVVQRRPLSKLVLIMDATTDATHAAHIVHRTRAGLPPISGNCHGPSPRITVIRSDATSHLRGDVLQRVLDAAFHDETLNDVAPMDTESARKPAVAEAIGGRGHARHG
jgi:hypothetical protein